MKSTTAEPNATEIAAIETATRKLARGDARLTETLDLVRRTLEDAELTGSTVAPDVMDALIERQDADQVLVERLSTELDAVKAAPALRAQRDKRAIELTAQAQDLVTRIAKWKAIGVALEAEAITVADAVLSEFKNPAHGFVTFLPPFSGSKVVEKLRHFFTVPNGFNRFAAHAAAFDGIGAPPRVITVTRGTGHGLTPAQLRARTAASKASTPFTVGDDGYIVGHP